MAVMAVTLLPLRVLLALLSLVLAWAVSCIGLLGLDKSRPVSNWRKRLQAVNCATGQFSCRCMGFQVFKTGVQASQAEAPVLIIAPHSSFFDALAVFWTGLPSALHREESRRIPLIGKCFEFAQAIFVNREDRDSREACKAEILRRCDPNLAEPWRQLLIFPEGTTTNRRALLSFKQGGFLPGQPVQPVLLKYNLAPGKDTVSWTWDQPHGFLTCLFLTACRWDTKVELEFLPPYRPDPEERADPFLFASNVRRLMAARLGVQLYDIGFKDIKMK
jgi:lysophosphatidylcholine acyltransferase/lyso-PAF acetyltransferase